MPPKSHRAGIAPGTLLCLIPFLSGSPGCSHHPLAGPGRTEEPLDPSLAAAYRPRHPGFGLRLEPIEGDSGRHHEAFSFRFSAYSEMEGDFKEIEGRFYRSRKIGAGERGPLIVQAPILAGAVDNYLSCRVFGRWACAAGMSSFYIHQEENILDGARDGIEFERLIRENIQDNIRALDLFMERPDVDPARLASLGISLGGIKNVVLAAVEPRLVAHVICLGGADLPRILLRSKERRVVRYLRQRGSRDGLTPAEIAGELGRHFRAEPTRFAAAIPSESMLLFLGSFDDKVPYEQGLILREKLGDPETYILALGHYTGIVAAPFAASRSFEFFRRRFERKESPARPAPVGGS